MKGLYIHIPFCQSRCIYCGFHSTTMEYLKAQYVGALLGEMSMRNDEIDAPWHTVYLGGGTPSRLSEAELERLFNVIDCSEAVEITMECNPDDITPEYAAMLRRLPVNRISMGAQTFSDDRLRFLRRRHRAQQVDEAVERLRRVGFDNISIDLMYGFPGETLEEWRSDIDHVLSLAPEHLSAYCLTFEKDTPLYAMLEEGKVVETDEETSRAMYETLMDSMAEAGFEHYEISNFARQDRRSHHNSSYWKDIPYVGIGAAAHSYNGSERSWNTADIKEYIAGINSRQRRYDSEPLSLAMRYNDFVMLSLRTCEGICLNTLEQRFGRQMLDYCISSAKRFVADGLLTFDTPKMTRSSVDNHSSIQLSLPHTNLCLTRSGIFVSDMIMSELFWLDE